MLYGELGFKLCLALAEPIDNREGSIYIQHLFAICSLLECFMWHFTFMLFRSTKFHSDSIRYLYFEDVYMFVLFRNFHVSLYTDGIFSTFVALAMEPSAIVIFIF